MGKSLKNSLKGIAKITNAEYWDLARKFSPTFASHTAEGTKIEFNLKGFEQITLSGTSVLNEFFEISMRVAFQLLNVSRAKNPLIDRGLVQVFDTPNGGIVQRMAVNSLKPLSPAFKNLEDGGSVDPYVIRKPEISERFFDMNFDYQNLVTSQDYQMKTMFINDYGMGQLLAGILEGLANGYTVQEYLNVKECLNAAINSSSTPLQDTQQIELSGGWTDAAPTKEQMSELVLTLQDTATRFEVVPQTGAYNALGFNTFVSAEDHILLMRAGIKNKLKTGLMVGAFNPEDLAIPFDIIEVEDFGGLVPYTMSGSTKVDLQPVYDKLGEEVGFIAASYTVPDGGYAYKSGDGYVIRVTGSDTPVDVIASPDGYTDPNANVLAMIVQKGAIFETAQNPYTVAPIYNPRGLYTNYIASRPNTGIHYDALYNVIVIYKGTTPAPVSTPIEVKVVNAGNEPIPAMVGASSALPVSIDDTTPVEVKVANSQLEPIPTTPSVSSPIPVMLDDDGIGGSELNPVWTQQAGGFGGE